MQADEWKVFVNNDVPVKFELNKKDVKATIEEVLKIRQGNNKSEIKEPLEELEEKNEAEERLNEYPEEIRELSYQILKEGDAFNFILETWNLRHVGDKNLGENCLCSVASTYILTSDMGLHVKPSGESGKGKSDSMQNVLNLLPEHKFISGSLSGKALFYDPNLKPGTIIYSDDAHLNDDIIATIKQSTSNYQAVTEHRTVVNGEFKHYYIPERCSYWFSSVDGIGDEQLANRFLNADVDGSITQDERVFKHVNEKEAHVYSIVDDDVLICRCIFEILGKELYQIRVPFAEAIEWKNKENRRNYQKFLDIIKAVTFFNAYQRENINGVYLADMEDFDRAVDIYTGTSKNNATNLTSREIEVLKFITGKNKYDANGNPTTINPTSKPDIMKHFNISAGRAHHILHGKDGKGGMLAKVAQLSKVDKSITQGSQDEDKITTKHNEYIFTGKKIGLEIYDTVANIDKKIVPKVVEDFKKKLLEETVTNCYPTVTPTNITVKTRTIDRIKSNVTQKRENKIEPKITRTSEQSTKNIHANSKSLSQTEKMGNSVIDKEETGQPNVINDDCMKGNSEVTVGNRCNSTEDEQALYAVAGLMKMALRNYAGKYKGPIRDLPELVRSFNKEVPEYEQRLGYDVILEEAEKINKHGWR